MSKVRYRKKTTTLNVKGMLVMATTIAGFAEIVGKSVDTIKRYEKEEVIPRAPFMLGDRRYYPISLVKALAPLIDKFPANKRPNGDIIVEIVKLFNQEKEKYAK